MRRFALSLFIAAFALPTCQSALDPSAESMALEAALTAFEEQWDALDAAKRETGLSLAIAEDLELDGWAPIPDLDWEADGHTTFTEHLALFLLLANERARTGESSLKTWRIRPSSQGEGWVELRRQDGQDYLARIESGQVGWECVQLDPVFPALDATVEDPRTYALALARRMAEIESVMPTTFLDDEPSRTYFTFSGCSLLRLLGAQKVTGVEEPMWPEVAAEDFHALFLFAPPFLSSWRIANEEGWQRKMWATGVDENAMGQTRVGVLLRTTSPEGKVRSDGISVSLVRQDGRWVAADVPISVVTEGHIEFAFDPASGQWSLQRDE